MYKNYDKALCKVNSYLTENHYSMSVIYSHLHTYRLFKQYLEKEHLSYSHEEAIKWLGINKEIWKHPKYKAARLSLYRLDDMIRNNCITNDSYVYDNSSSYDRLPKWCRLLLDAYLNDLSNVYGEAYINEHRISCSKFLIYISCLGGYSEKDINHKNVLGYYDQSKHNTNQSKNSYNRNIRHFLHYLADKNLVHESLEYTLDRFVIPRIILIDELSDEEKSVYIRCLEQSTFKISACEYYSFAKELGDIYLERHNYSKTIKNIYRKALRELFIFLEANNLWFSYEIAICWCTHIKEYTVQWKFYRRAMKLFEQYMKWGDIKPNIVYSYKEDSINILPEWSRGLLIDFLSKKKMEGNSLSTISMYRSSCLRFLKFLDIKGIKCCTMINPGIIKDFHISDPHSISEAKNAYSTRIRGFLDYLADLGYLPVSLRLALTTECAQKSEIIVVLTEEEITSVYKFRLEAKKPMELRDSAIVLIGIRMGLRASDITGMKLSDISWENRTISVQQHKTNRFLLLPIPVDVLNSLYKYIMNGRPCVNSDYIFISHRVPYGKLDTSCCRRALNNVLNKQKHGFHITRKTFASLMLKSRTNTNMIAESLGHSDTSTVLKYLATNDETMRQCALSLKGIEVNGGLLS